MSLLVVSYQEHLNKNTLLFSLSHPKNNGLRRRDDCPRVAGNSMSGGLIFIFVKKESPPSIMVIRKPKNWSFRDSRVRDWLRKGKVLAPLVRPT